VSGDVYVTPPLSIGLDRLELLVSDRDRFFFAKPLELGEDEVVRFALTAAGRIVGVRVEQAA
jgi:hypothetical protein